MTQISDIFLQRIARIIRIFRRKRRRWPDAEQSEWQEPPRLKNPYNPCNPLWKNTSDGIREISCRLRLREMHFLSGWKN